MFLGRYLRMFKEVFENCTYELSYILPIIDLMKVLVFCLKNMFVNLAPALSVFYETAVSVEHLPCFNVHLCRSWRRLNGLIERQNHLIFLLFLHSLCQSVHAGKVNLRPNTKTLQLCSIESPMN